MAPFFVTVVDEDASPEDVLSLVCSSEISLVISFASFASSKCDALLDGVDGLEQDYDGMCGLAPKPSVLVLRVDASDTMEEAALELGLAETVPSFQVYKDGALFASSGDGEEATVEAVRSALRRASSQSCCDPAPDSKDDVRRLVGASYAQAARKARGCRIPSVDSTLNGYTAEDLLKVGADANLGLGCGNPLGFAGLREGETVLDLGSGAGIDCFLASDGVGPTGTVIGVDMTPDMVHKARDNKKKRGFDNVQFRLGEIEHLPVADGTVDCAISNCVINLSPDKGQVYRDIYRVLRVGGRIAISDVVTRPDKVIPEELKTVDALAC